MDLAGKVLLPPRGQERLKEAVKVGFRVAVMPKVNMPEESIEGLAAHDLERIEQFMAGGRGLGSDSD